MKMYRFAFASAALGLFGLGFAQLAEHVPGELLVKFVPGQSTAINQPIGATVKNYIAAIGVSTVKLPANMSVEQGLTYYRSKTGVSYADPNYIAHADWMPNDPMFGQQYGPQKIQCIPAWDTMKGGATTKIAIIDTGVDYNHPDLAGKVLAGKDFVNGDDDAMDDNGHGTHCAGNASANTNNGVGIAGIAPLCSIIPIKVLSAGGSGSFDWVAGGITWAADNGANVISMSLGGSSGTQALQDAVIYALGKNVVVCASAGNNGDTNPNYPGFYPECIAVAATDSNDQKAGFSTYGDWVDVAAPGVDILSTLPGGAYGAESGTSMACPIVAGLAGLIRSYWPVGTAAQVRAQIENNCDNVGNFVIHGRVNALKSIPILEITDPFSYAPTAAEMFEGKQAYNTYTNLAASDNRYYAVSSKLVDRLGHVASTKVTFTYPKLIGKLRSLSLKIEAAGASYVTGSAFVWNNTTSKWDYLGSWPLPSADSVRSFTLAKPYSNYFNATKQMQVLVRAVMPVSQVHAPILFALKVDQAQLTGRAAR